MSNGCYKNTYAVIKRHWIVVTFKAIKDSVVYMRFDTLSSYPPSPSEMD